MDEAAFQSLLNEAQQQQQPAAPPPPQPAPPPAAEPAVEASGGEPELPAPRQDLSVLDRGVELVGSVAGGVGNSVLETKDFLFGEPSEEDKSQARKDFEATNRQLMADSPLNGFVLGVSQFVTGLLGANKLLAGAKLLPVAGRLVEAGGAAIEGSGSFVKAAAEAAKAAAVGAVVFDPHEARLSNLVESIPILSNPITNYLQAKEDDPVWEGRFKSAMESIGIDAALGATLFGATKLYRAIRGGDEHGATAAAEETQKAYQALTTKGGEVRDVLDGPEGSPTGQSVHVAPDQSGAPAGMVRVVDDAGRETFIGDRLLGEPQARSAAQGADRIELPKASPDDLKVAPVEDIKLPKASPDDLKVNPVEGEKPNLGATVKDKVETGATGAPDASGQQPQQSGAEFSAVPNATEAAAQEGVKLPPRYKLPEIPDDELEQILEGMKSDNEAIDKAGSWFGAFQDGHNFGKGDRVPWQKMDTGDDPSGGTVDFISRVADAIQKDVDKASGGEVVSDAKVQRMVNQRASLFDEDPAALLGMIQTAGKGASKMVADMEAGYLVSQRAFQDAFTMATRINAGMLDEWGNDATAAIDALKAQLGVAADAYSGARSITANAGRALRRMRSEFRIDPEAVRSLQRLDGDRLAYLVANTAGDPKAMAQIVQTNVLGKIAEWSNFLQINNLLWGWKTHLVNMATNGYMLAARPAERIVGSFAVEGGQSIRSEAMRQYLYMGTALGDAFHAAKEAFVLGDSKLAPHNTELYRVGQTGAPGANALNFQPWGSLSGLIHNVLVVSTPKNLLTLPTRSLGFADEMMKQITYRSKVLAAAQVDGMERGLAGQDLRNYVQLRLRAAFDARGVGLDAAAKREAQIATFQQDLLPGTVGKVVQDGTAQLPALKLILPFVKTPTNVLRYGWKMTPGLNLLQTEYRRMITGGMGKEAQAQAVGQMGLGALWMGYTAFRAAQGHITGGGPTDPKQRSALLATGWQPYSYVTLNDDGSKTYTPFGKFDPIAMPMGIIADLSDVLHIASVSDDEELASNVEDGATALLISLAKQMANKSYLVNLSNAIDAFDEPDKRGANFVGSVAANMVPFSSAMRQFNPDPYLRDARGVVDKIMATVPGLSELVPARYDAWGDPITVRKGLSSTMEDDLVDREVERQGLSGIPVFTQPSPSIGNGTDLRDITMKDGRNAYEAYQQLAGQPAPGSPRLKAQIARIMTTKAYATAPDGPVEIKGTKSWMLAGAVSEYRTAALKIVKADPNVRAALLKETLRVQSAYSQKRSDPTGGKQGAKGLAEIGNAFGVDLSAFLGGAAPNGK